MSNIKRGFGLLLAFVMLFSCTITGAAAVSVSTLNAALNDTAKYVYNTVKDPQVGSIGGEWAVMALARSGYTVPEEYYHKYYATLEKYVKDCGGNLHDKKYTEYSRVILALSAIGKDPRDVAGYDLLKPLGDYDKTIWQGLNGPVFALIALDAGNYAMPKNESAKVQATREMYIKCILDRQLADGGFNLTSQGAADPDITGMALQALAKYQDREDVAKVINEALECMSKMQNEGGGFSSWGTENSESVVQIIVALCELGIPLDDPRFVKNGNTLLDNLMTFYKAGEGFIHTQDGSGANLMATEQALYALVAAQRARDGKPSLYRMTSDALDIGLGSYTGLKPGEGLTGKNADVKASTITRPGITFDDISGKNYHENTPAIESLAARGIITGKSETEFAPNATMTRAEFATIIVRALGLTAKENGKFTDVPTGQWYSGFIGTANSYGIVNGKTAAEFDPNGTITREEAAVMTARAAKLCGIDTSRDTSAVRDTLAQFFDYVKTSEWARESLAVCYDLEVLSQSDDEIRPGDAILRCEVAQMLYNLLAAANLL